MKKSSTLDLRKNLSNADFLFVVIVTVLVSFFTISLIVDNFSEELNLSPFAIGGGSATRVLTPQVGVGEVPNEPPTRPVNVQASEGNSLIAVTWEDPLQGIVEGFKIYRTDTNVFTNEILVKTVDNSLIHRWIDTSLNPSDAKYYWVSAYNSAGESSVSQFDRGTVSLTIGKRWEYQSDRDLYNSFSLGGNGLEIFTFEREIFLDSHAKLFDAAGNVNNPNPLQDYLIPSYFGGTVYRTTASKDNNFYALAYRRVPNFGSQSGTAVVRVYNSNSQNLLFEYSFPGTYTPLGASIPAAWINDVGTVMVAYLHDPTVGGTRVVRFDLTSGNPGNPVSEVVIPTSSLYEAAHGNNPGVRFSEDGTVGAILSRSGSVHHLRIFNVMTGATIYYSGSIYAHVFQQDAFDMTADGSKLAVGFNYGFQATETKVDIYELNGQSYSKTTMLTLPDSFSEIIAMPRAVALSDDGKTLVAGYNFKGTLAFPDPDALFGVVAYDLVTNQQTMNFEVVGGGDLKNYVEMIRLNEDGTQFAISTWGDIEDYSEEIFIFSTVQDDPVASFSVGHSVYDLELSSDGTKIIAGVRDSVSHVETGGSVSGSVQVFDIV